MKKRSRTTSRRKGRVGTLGPGLYAPALCLCAYVLCKVFLPNEAASYSYMGDKTL